MPKPDIRKIFRGADAGAIIRAGAKDLLERAIVNGDKRERMALQHAYTTSPTLEVTVERVRDEPPLWRMTTVAPLLAEAGQVYVEDGDRNMLESEMRLKARNLLLQHGYFDKHLPAEQREKARQWVTSMKIEVRGVILLRDSQRHNREWNR